MDTFFQRTLDDLIKGLRLSTTPTTTFISRSLDEIRKEIKSPDPTTKTTALEKLTYLHSLHSVDMSWASFHSVELSSSPLFRSKRAAYLAASLSFDPSTTDVILLLTHQLRKDLSSTNPHEVSLALQVISSISTVDLARDLTPELFNLLGSGRVFVKKKAISAVLRVFELYPDAVRVCFKRLVESLENSDVGVLSAVVGVFCELASKDPRAYLPLAPEFYRVLVDSRNNWVLIKVLKIFAKLAPLEPRLGRKVVEPICEHLRRTGAKSLAFECMRTIVEGLSEFDAAVKLVVEKIREFLMEDDPNLKYLGLEVLGDVGTKHLWAVLENKEVVIKSLSDDDENIKLAALKLVMVMVSEDNVAEICRVLISYALKSDPYFCNEILEAILSTCSKNYYENIIDFDWYVSLLGEMSRIPHCQKGEEIENQLVDIGMRVKDVRLMLVRVARDLLIDPALLGNPFIHKILSAAAWVSGEYVEFSRNPLELMEALLQPRTGLLPPLTRAVYVHAAFKVLCFSFHSYFLQKEAVDSSISRVNESIPKNECSEASDLVTGAVDEQDTVDGVACNSSVYLKLDKFSQEFLFRLVDLVESNLSPLVGSPEVEIQERVKNIIVLIGLIRREFSGCSTHEEGASEMSQVKASEVVELLNEVFSEEIGPVSSSAQKRVPLPDGLELKENLKDLEVYCSDFKVPASVSFSLGKPYSLETNGITDLDHKKEEGHGVISESTSLLAEHRKRHGLYYLPSEEIEKVSNDYPPANDLSVRDKSNDQTEALFKLTEQSLVPKKKLGQSKPRPVVVRLDEGDAIPAKEKLETEVDLISGAVRDVLLGSESVASSSASNKPDKSSSKRNGKGKSRLSDVQAGSTHVDSSELGNMNPKGNKHRSHGNEKSHRSSRKGTSEQDQKEKVKSSSHRSRPKSRHRADVTVDLTAQSPIIPDFLL